MLDTQERAQRGIEASSWAFWVGQTVVRDSTATFVPRKGLVPPCGVCEGQPGTNAAHSATASGLGACYGMPGTDVAYGTRSGDVEAFALQHRQHRSSSSPFCHPPPTPSSTVLLRFLPLAPPLSTSRSLINLQFARRKQMVACCCLIFFARQADAARGASRLEQLRKQHKREFEVIQVRFYPELCLRSACLVLVYPELCLRRKKESSHVTLQRPARAP
eukprot:1268671-Rhodomonas_salina.1